MLCFFNLISCSFTQGFFSCFGYQVLQELTNGTLSKNKSFLLDIHVQIYFSESIHSKLQNTSNLQFLVNLQA
jgi:hypothetical protein